MSHKTSYFVVVVDERLLWLLQRAHFKTPAGFGYLI